MRSYDLLVALSNGMVTVMTRMNVPAVFVDAWETNWHASVIDQIETGLSPEGMVANIMENLVHARQLTGTYGRD